MLYQGSCHCGAVLFEVDADDKIKCGDCNCSICTKSGYLHLIVPASKFRLLKGASQITAYTWGTGIAKHTFCKVCGIKSFYTPRSNPDGYDINVRCLDIDVNQVEIEPFDGKNWEKNAHTLRHMSVDAE